MNKFIPLLIFGFKLIGMPTVVEVQQFMNAGFFTSSPSGFLIYRDPRDFFVIYESRSIDRQLKPYNFFVKNYLVTLESDEIMEKKIKVADYYYRCVQHYKKENPSVCKRFEDLSEIDVFIRIWIHYLSPKQISFFKKHFGQLLIDLGYEKDLSW